MAEGKVFVSFTCQRCLQPLCLDDSLNSFGEHILAELSLPIHLTPDVDLESQATSFDNYIHPCRLSDSGNGANGFMLISDGHEVDTLGKTLEVRSALFDTLSGNSNIDHPLCDECTDALIEFLEGQINLTETDYQDYCKYLKKLDSESTEPRLSELEKELQDLKNEEQQLMHELENLQQEEIATLEAIKEQEKESNRLALEEDKYWSEYNKHRKDFLLTEDEYRSLECQMAYTQTQLDKLNKMNAFNATFHIWHSGHFGTINNFRLGRLPTAPIDWSEINAAWGQSALLLAALARKINLTFEKYKLVPYGNHSYILVIDDQRELPLYGTGGFKFLWDNRFDTGMAAFLDCLQQFKNKVDQSDKEFALPYRMSRGGRIEDTTTGYSIKIQLNSEEQWTKALKFMLTNLKWSLAWVCSQFSNVGEGVNV